MGSSSGATRIILKEELGNMLRESSFWRYVGLILREKLVIFYVVFGVYCIGVYLFFINWIIILWGV